MKWGDVRRIELEISNVCNSACPQCARHPTYSNFINPVIREKRNWTLQEIQRCFPIEDLTKIESYLFNGDYGDFIANNDALEIIQYFSSASPNARFHINTNGSARPTSWWRQLAKIPDLKVTFALDGLSDTHHLYRRNTDFDTIIRNASAFIKAGGRAEWIMTVFAHNDHQIEQCRELSISLGFHEFTPRFSDRGDSLVTHDGKPLYFIRQSKMFDMKSTQHPVRIGKMILDAEKKLENGEFSVKQIHNCNPLQNKNDCISYRLRAVRVGADGFVSPCGYLGRLGYNINQQHYGFDDFIQKLAKHNLTYDDLFVKDKVSDVVNFNWIYDSLETTDALSVCYKNCNASTSTILLAKKQISELFQDKT